MTNLQHPVPSRRLGWLAAALVLLAALVIECAVFNLPFWRTAGASTDSSSAVNRLGAGLERTPEGLLRVIDPTQAWLELTADGTSPYARIDVVDADRIDQARKSMDENEARKLISTVHVRIDVDGVHGRAQQFSSQSASSRYLNAPGAGQMRVWIEEPTGTLLPLDAARANVRVPFRVNLARLAVMLALAGVVALLRPGARLWRVRLDTRARAQRLAFWSIMGTLLAAATVAFVLTLCFAWPLSFHKPGAYTYDFDQYGHTADALLSGHAWLDLEVPKALAEADNPLDVTTRNQLLADGVTPLYWDYAFKDGHWYSYFGVLPALLLFAPYRAITSLFVEGGLMMPAAAAVICCMALFVLFGSLLVIRLIDRIAPGAPLAAVVIALTVFVLGSNAPYLMYRTNFYTVPFAASLALTMLGLWLWLEAAQPKPGKARGRWQIGDVPALSLPHLAGGALAIAANIGCRPTFVLTALLAFPLFWPQIAALMRALRGKTTTLRHAAAPVLAMLLPAAIVVIPQLAWNLARFGSPLDFGDAYQMTVTDMTRFTLPTANLLPMIGEYLFTPIRWTSWFPWIGMAPTPMPEWGYAEPIMGGLFMLCPFALLAFALPFLRRRMRESGRWGLLLACLGLGLALVVFDSLRGGLGWRYMADFGWMITLAAMPALMTALGCANAAPGDPTDASAARTWASRLRLSCARWAVLALLMANVVITVLVCFTPGRSDELMSNIPSLWHDVASWFTLL